MITVLGIGNIILSDEGLGVRAVEFLQSHFKFDPSIQILDGGTLGIELTYFIEENTDHLLIIDSIDGDTNPGTIFHIENDDIRKHFAKKISSHEIGIQDVLTSMELTGKKISNVVVIGAQPYNLDAGLELSAGMKKILPWIILDAMKILKSWGVKMKYEKSFDAGNRNELR